MKLRNVNVMKFMKVEAETLRRSTLGAEVEGLVFGEKELGNN